MMVRRAAREAIVVGVRRETEKSSNTGVVDIVQVKIFGSLEIL